MPKWREIATSGHTDTESFNIDENRAEHGNGFGEKKRQRLYLTAKLSQTLIFQIDEQLKA